MRVTWHSPHICCQSNYAIMDSPLPQGEFSTPLVRQRNLNHVTMESDFPEGSKSLPFFLSLHKRNYKLYWDDGNGYANGNEKWKAATAAPNSAKLHCTYLPITEVIWLNSLNPLRFIYCAIMYIFSTLNDALKSADPTTSFQSLWQWWEKCYVAKVIDKGKS